jgi:predicted ATPase
VCDVLAAACTHPVPGVVFVDDAQWADESSRDLLGFFVRRLRGVALCVVLTWRTEEVPPAHPLRRMYSAANRAGLGLGLTLTRLTEQDVADVVRETGAGDDAFAATLYEESAGVPFFLVEYLAASRGVG